jgi:hypothetical protein
VIEEKGKVGFEFAPREESATIQIQNPDPTMYGRQ